MKLGYFLSCEEHSPGELIETAIAAEEAGFSSVLISDHFHPWIDRQGESPFVWSVIGAIAATHGPRDHDGRHLPDGAHPSGDHRPGRSDVAVARHGRFRLGLGTGEKLNEHILGDRWPSAEVRLEMLEEAIEVIRALLKGRNYSHHGPHYTVENARLYSLPDTAPPILVSGFGPLSIASAASTPTGSSRRGPPASTSRSTEATAAPAPRSRPPRCAGGPTNPRPDARRSSCGRPRECPASSPKSCPMPRHFEQAVSVVTEDMVAEAVPCGPDPERHLAALRKYADAGFDELFVNQIGDDAPGFFKFFNDEIRSHLE